MAQGKSRKEVMQTIKLGKTTFWRHKKQLHATGHLKVIKQSGRPKKLNERDLRHLKFSMKKNGKQPAKEIAKRATVELSKRMVHKYLRVVLLVENATWR